MFSIDQAKNTGIGKRLMWFTGTPGFLLTLILAPLLSRLAFGNGDFTYAFVALSIVALIGQLSAGKEIILRSARKVDLLSRATVFGALMGLVSSVSLYYFFGNRCMSTVKGACMLTSVVFCSPSTYIKCAPTNDARVEKYEYSCFRLTRQRIQASEVHAIIFERAAPEPLTISSAFLNSVTCSANEYCSGKTSTNPSPFK